MRFTIGRLFTRSSYRTFSYHQTTPMPHHADGHLRLHPPSIRVAMKMLSMADAALRDKLFMTTFGFQRSMRADERGKMPAVIATPLRAADAAAAALAHD